MNFYLFADILVGVLFAWTALTLGMAVYYEIFAKRTVSVAPWAILIFFVSLAYGFARFYS